MPTVSSMTATPAYGPGDALYAVTAGGNSRKLLTMRVATIADMTAILVPTNGMSVEVTDLDRGGFFVFDTSVAAAGNGGTTFSADDATTGSWVRQYSGPVDVRWFGADPTGAIASHTEINAALTEFNDVYFPNGSYLTEAVISVTGGKRITADRAVILKNYDGVGMAFTGGASFNVVEGELEVRGNGAFASAPGSASASPTAHGITITNNRMRVNGLLKSSSHQGNGFSIASTAANSNRCTYRYLHAYDNGEHGVYFSGTDDNCSVWDIKIHADGNRKSGIYCTDDYMGRNWNLFAYSENNGLDLTSHSCYFGKLRFSQLWVYAEQQVGTGKEVYLGANTYRLYIFSQRRNLDEDAAFAAGENTWRYANQIYNPGFTGAARNAQPLMIRADKARATSAGEYVDVALGGASASTLGKIRAEGGATSPSVALLSADATSWVKTANDAFSVSVAGTTILSGTSAGVASPLPITFTAVTAASAPNNSLFVDSADGVLKFKNSGGTVNTLY